MKRLALFAVLAALVVPAMAGSVAPKEELYVLVPKSVVHPYWARVKKGMEAEAARLGVKAVFDGPTTNDLTRQLDIIEGYVTRRAAGIAISPNDPRGVEAIIFKAVRRDIPVITFDSDAPLSERALYVGTVNKEAGRVAGREMVRVLGGKGQVAVLHGSITALNLRERLDGFREVVDQYPGIEVVGLEENGDDATLATSQAENLLTHWPKLAAFYGTSAPGAPAAVTALRERGRLGKVKVVGFDLSPENAKAIERGWITVIIEQRPYRMGELALRWLVKLHRGDKAAVSVVDTGVDVVTKDNVKALAASLK